MPRFTRGVKKVSNGTDYQKSKQAIFAFAEPPERDGWLLAGDGSACKKFAGKLRKTKEILPLWRHRTPREEGQQVKRWWLMNDEKKERRKFPRIFFSIEDGVKGVFAFSDPQRGLLVAYIINIGEGGLGLAFNKDKKFKIARGDQVIITHITGVEGLESLVNVDAKIKWILENPSLEYVLFGCEFLDIPKHMRDAVGIFIDSWSPK